MVDDITKGAYRKAIDAAAQELEILLGRREELESELEKVQARIEVLQFGLDGLAAVSGVEAKEIYPDLYPEEQAMSDIGFTDAVRKVMSEANRRTLFTPVVVRDLLQEKGFDLSKYNNPLASIHTILKRLRDMGEVIAAPDSETGKLLYMWNFGGKRI